VIVAPVTVEERDGEITRTAHVTWSTGEFTLWCRGPAPVVDTADEGSAFLCAALPVAMRIGEDLTCRSPVSPALADRLHEIQTAYRAWNPEWRPVDVELATADPVPSPPGPTASLFSRGVDSSFTAAHGDARTLLFGDHLEPRHDPDVRAEEIRRAGAAASRLGRELLVVDTNVRAFTDIFGTDWEDVSAAGLSFMAHNLSAGLGRIVIPSSDSYDSVEPCGSSPLLDPLFSTERVAIEHDTIAFTRLDKLRWLAAQPVDLLPFLKVCYAQNRPDNCGRCGKCLYTMACLRALGVLARATEFPHALDLALVRQLRLPHLKARIDWAELMQELGAENRDMELHDAIVTTLRASTVSARYELATAAPWVPHRWTRDSRLNLTLSLALEGQPAPPTGGGHDAPSLLEVAGGAGRGYRLGSLPYPGAVRELGALVARPLPGAIPVWFANGELRTRGMQRPVPAPRRRRWRWALAPLGSRSASGRRLRDTARRLRHLRGRKSGPAGDLAGPPSGYLHQTDGPARTPLFAGWHPVLGHQILTTEPAPSDDRPGGVMLLGYLEPPAAR
jgi:hypothetical protein